MPNLPGYHLPPEGACLQLICIQNKFNVCFQHIFNICHSLVNYSSKSRLKYFNINVSSSQYATGKWEDNGSEEGRENILLTLIECNRDVCIMSSRPLSASIHSVKRHLSALHFVAVNSDTFYI